MCNLVEFLVWFFEMISIRISIFVERLQNRTVKTKDRYFYDSDFSDEISTNSSLKKSSSNESSNSGSRSSCSHRSSPSKNTPKFSDIAEIKIVNENNRITTDLDANNLPKSEILTNVIRDLKSSEPSTKIKNLEQAKELDINGSCKIYDKRSSDVTKFNLNEEKFQFKNTLPLLNLTTLIEDSSDLSKVNQSQTKNMQRSVLISTKERLDDHFLDKHAYRSSKKMMPPIKKMFSIDGVVFDKWSKSNNDSYYFHYTRYNNFRSF
jgi:hypothetical protein